MKIKAAFLSTGFFLAVSMVFGQTKQDSLKIKQAALDHVESQHQLMSYKFPRNNPTAAARSPLPFLPGS